MSSRAVQWLARCSWSSRINRPESQRRGLGAALRQSSAQRHVSLAIGSRW